MNENGRATRKLVAGLLAFRECKRKLSHLDTVLDCGGYTNDTQNHILEAFDALNAAQAQVINQLLREIDPTVTATKENRVMTEPKPMEEIVASVRPEEEDQIKRLDDLRGELMGMMLTASETDPSGLVMEALRRIAFDMEDGIKNGL